MIFEDRENYVNKNPYFTKEDCPFCKLENDEKKLLLHETKYWEIRYNKYPYYGYKQNLLAFPKVHKADTIELTTEEIIDFKNIEIFMNNYFLDKNYFSFIRQGKGGRSIEHLHYHYLEGIIVHNNEDNKSFKILNV